MKRLFAVSLLIGLTSVTSAYADVAPVTSATPANDQQSSLDTDTSNMTLDQRVAILERQMSALNQVNLLDQVNNLQQQVQTLQGQLDVLTHNLQTLQTQSTSQYADLDTRLTKLTGGNTNTSSNASAVVTDANAAPTEDQSNDDSAVTDKASTDSNATTENQSSTESTASAASSNAEQQAYQAAYDKVKNKNYSGAITALQAFVTQYPTGEYTANAYYWLGQLYLIQGDGKNAEKEFNILIAKYPKNPKIADANLKLGFAYILQNKMSTAKEQFKEVIAQYPGSPTAKQAQDRLAQMQ